MTNPGQPLRYVGCGGGGHTPENPTGLRGELLDPQTCHAFLVENMTTYPRGMLAHQPFGWLDQLTGAHWSPMPVWMRDQWRAAASVAREVHPDTELWIYGSCLIGPGGCGAQDMGWPDLSRPFDVDIPTDRAVLSCQIRPWRNECAADMWILDAGSYGPYRPLALKAANYIKRRLHVDPAIEAFPLVPRPGGGYDLDLVTMSNLTTVALLSFVRLHDGRERRWDVSVMPHEAVILVQPSSNWVNGVWTDMPWPPPAWAWPTADELTSLVQRGFTLAPMDWGNCDAAVQAAYAAQAKS